jgi:hypothetical protein
MKKRLLIAIFVLGLLALALLGTFLSAWRR